MFSYFNLGDGFITYCDHHLLWSSPYCDHHYSSVHYPRHLRVIHPARPRSQSRLSEGTRMFASGGNEPPMHNTWTNHCRQFSAGWGEKLLRGANLPPRSSLATGLILPLIIDRQTGSQILHKTTNQTVLCISVILCFNGNDFFLRTRWKWWPYWAKPSSSFMDTYFGRCLYNLLYGWTDVWNL